MQTKYGKYNYNGYSPQFAGNKMSFKKRTLDLHILTVQNVEI